MSLYFSTEDSETGDSFDWRLTRRGVLEVRVEGQQRWRKSGVNFSTVAKAQSYVEDRFRHVIVEGTER